MYDVLGSLVKNVTWSPHLGRWADFGRWTARTLLAYENIVWFLWDFYETILVGKFPSREIGEKCTSRRLQMNFTRSRCNIIVKLKAASHGRACSPFPHAGMHEVVWSLPHAVRLSSSCMLLWTMNGCLHCRLCLAPGVSRYYIGTVGQS